MLRTGRIPAGKAFWPRGVFGCSGCSARRQLPVVLGIAVDKTVCFFLYLPTVERNLLLVPAGYTDGSIFKGVISCRY